MTHSLMEGAMKVGMDISIASPPGYLPNGNITEKAIKVGKQTGCSLLITNDPLEAVKDADVIVTDVWTSMGQEDETEKRLKAFQGFQVNDELCKLAKEDFIFLHCLPAHRGEEVTAEVIDGSSFSRF